METVHIMLGSPDKQRIMPPMKESDIYVGVDRGAVVLIENGYKPDLVLGDFDSITFKEKQMIEKAAHQYLEFPPEKDDTDAELSLVYVMDLFEADQVIFYGWSGGRIDHLISILMIAVQPRFQSIISKLYLIDKTNTISFFLPGAYDVSKETDKKYCSLIGLTEIKNLNIKNGFKYTLDHIDYTYPVALISNEFTADHASFDFEKGIMAFIQSKDK